MSIRHHLARMLSHGRTLLAEPQQKPRSPGLATRPFDVFLTDDAAAINNARQQHLASLGLDLRGKKVLEVGAGIGLHTPFFLQLGCEVVITDGNRENVAEAKRRHRALRVECVDLDSESDLRHLGAFDVVYCYGLLYHLAGPERAIQRMAEVSTGMLLLETCLSLGRYAEVIFLKDFESNNQATTGIGCRPTRAWVLAMLNKYFGHGYQTRTQPEHHDFPTDWDLAETRLLYRGVFVGSKQPLRLPTLTDVLPTRQVRYTSH